MTVATRVAFRFESFAAFPLAHGVSGRDASLPAEGDIGYATDNDSREVAENRRAFALEVGFASEALTLGKQVHGAKVSIVTARDRGRGQPPRFDAFPGVDGLVTDDPAVAIGVFVADCVPLLLYDPCRHVAGVVHAGWRGTTRLIAAEAVLVMVQQFGSDTRDIRVGIGPSIGPCCYQVGHEVIDDWNRASVANGQRAVARVDGSYHFDLWSANQLILQQAGVSGCHIEDSGLCTRCHHQYLFSHRAWKQGLSTRGRMLLVAQLAPHAEGSANS